MRHCSTRSGYLWCFGALKGCFGALKQSMWIFRFNAKNRNKACGFFALTRNIKTKHVDFSLYREKSTQSMCMFRLNAKHQNKACGCFALTRTIHMLCMELALKGCFGAFHPLCIKPNITIVAKSLLLGRIGRLRNK